MKKIIYAINSSKYIIKHIKKWHNHRNALMGETRNNSREEIRKDWFKSSKHMKGPGDVQVLLNTTEMLFEIKIKIVNNKKDYKTHAT